MGAYIKIYWSVKAKRALFIEAPGRSQAVEKLPLCPF
jgi:hypothetical protein